MNRSPKVKLFVGAAVVIGLIVAARVLNVQQWVGSYLEKIDEIGSWASVAFVLLYILACVLFLPGWILTLGAGAIFGIVHATIYVVIGANLGALAAFFVGRYLARDWVAERIKANQKFEAIDQAVAREGWKIVFLARLSPIFPFNLLNYAFGLTKVRWWHYSLASFVGMMPGTIMYVYIGSVMGEVAAVGTMKRQKTPAEWGLYIVGLISTVAVAIYVTRVARRAIKQKVAGGTESALKRAR